jgi:predicted Zn-dependent protease with MMP-like domain
MDWFDAEAPSLDDFAALARRCFAALPAEFRTLCEDVVMRVDDLPTDEVCAELGLESPFELTGLYQGVDLTRRNSFESGTMPDMIFLYRRPILDEWSEAGTSLGALVTHVLVHEIGHHFGLSDEAMHTIEDQAARETT